jgi:hypothetical protein
MIIPGFTAEASVYASAVSYRSMRVGLQGEGTSVTLAQGACVPINQTCSACIPSGPSIFSPGRQFCQIFTCRPTLGGGCRCSLLFKGFLACRVDYGGVLTQGWQGSKVSE